jgi:hypothetical protein
MILLPTVAAPADRPTSRPVIPALIVGTPPPKSFIVEGILRSSATTGWAFRVATDGQRQLVALYDSADGTPIFLSDGQQTLIYDLANSRVVRVPSSRGNVRVDWEAQKEKPLNFGFGVQVRSTPEELEHENAWFRIDRFADAALSLKQVGNQGKSTLFAAERADGKGIESLQVEPGQQSWFRFTSLSKGQPFYRFQLDARAIDRPVAARALSFPDLQRLPPDVHLTDLDQQVIPAFLVLLRDGRVWMA